MIRLGLILFLILFSVSLFSQKKTTINIENADKVVFNQNDKKYKDANRAIGNVRLRHENMLMFCDSAHLYKNSNIVHAYGRIHIKQGDTLNIYGDSLRYDGTKHFGQLRGKIRMVENDLKLETDSIDFNTEEHIAYYTNWATITSQKDNNVLRSKKGTYHSKSKELFFKDSVTLTHPDYTMWSDTLKYHVTSQTAHFFGPTVIRTKESTMYCERGWYNTKKENALFSQRAYFNKKEHTLRGDSIFYDMQKGKGVARSNISLLDTVNKVILQGNYGEYEEKTENMLVTERALMIKIMDDDSLFLHADTLIARKDTSKNKQVLRAFHHVKFYKSDLQGKCDSIVFDERDSTLKLFHHPVMWHEENQLTAEYMEMRIVNENPESILLENECFIISEADTVGFNQIKGKKMYGKFNGDKLQKVNVYGNGQTVYYAAGEKKDSLSTEKRKEYFGMNKTECSDIVIYLNEKSIDKITFITNPDAVFYPMDKINPKDRMLKGFRWEEKSRPGKKEDIFKVN